MEGLPLGNLRVAELRYELQQRGLDTTGLKPALLVRLGAALKQAAVPGAARTPLRDDRRSNRIISPDTDQAVAQNAGGQRAIATAGRLAGVCVCV